ncbi:uncharacterized protein EV420DRAFT_1570129 [Desarmillaria tabescens]|uniref:Uncharacterized protein n=1 Tax=Armillaria tabescens TaxID=1929756 RepID=A0AA39MUJ4_ARMTA|nr:uncharacterized protein EV420DRAFT_1570129 [Desarmillaria tabescens]KAK0446569.1 hypothetical protein EV420DRAFT_1570129 [Desarmillaria tabescens]
MLEPSVCSFCPYYFTDSELTYVGPRNVTDRQQKSKQTTGDIIRSFVHQFDTYQLAVLYIAFYTAFAIYFDDVYPDDPDALVGVPIFTKVNIDVYMSASEIPLISSTQHFASSEKQPNKMLDDFANILAEASQLFGEVTADFIVQAVLRFMTALILETRSISEPVSNSHRQLGHLLIKGGRRTKLTNTQHFFES